jgi:peptidyl-prolyl cis-trans isomerase SurA
MVEKIKGKQRDVYHILMQPKADDADVERVRDSLEAYRERILKMEMTFEDAVLRYSDDKDTRLNEGVLMNPVSGDTKFEQTRMDPELYSKVSSLEEGELSRVFLDETRQGTKMFKVLLLKSKTQAHEADLGKDYEKIMDLALQKKKTESIEKWSEEKIQDTYVKINDAFMSCEFKSDWSKKSL